MPDEHVPSVAVVILNWNGRSYLEKYLPSVFASTYPNLQVIVADNASTDDSISFLRHQYPSLRLILLDRNYGFAEGYNRALQEVDAKYLVLLNSDVEVTPGWVEPVTRLMEKDPAIAACQPKIRALLNRAYFEYAGAAGGWLDRYGYPFCRGRVFDVCEKDTGQYDDPAPVFWASGACMFVRASAFKSAGGFDGFFFAHQEEIDLCWRLQILGYRVFVQPESIVYHLGGGTLAAGNKRKVYLNHRNNLVMLARNMSGRKKFQRMFVRMTLDGITAFQYLLKGRGGSFMAIMKAHYSFYGWLLKHNKPGRNAAGKEGGVAGIYGGSIVWDFFIKKKKTFSEIVYNKA